jgi:4-hydroxy-3-polyprenylbenzoate decarboxylase
VAGGLRGVTEAGAIEPSLQGFLGDWERRHPDDVIHVHGEVEPDFISTAMALDLEAQGRAPIIVLDRPAGSELPLVANVFGSWERLAEVIGTDRAGFNDAWLAAERAAVPPRMVTTGVSQEVVEIGDDADVTRLPIARHFAGDAGKYVSAGILVANDPNTGVRNLSFQRMQLKGPRKFGVSLHSRGHIWDYQRRAELQGRPLEVAVVVGAHPTLLMAATARVGINVDEYTIAGGLLGQPVELVKAKTIDVDVPAWAEVIIEGRILPGVREPEGPFGEFPGYSTSRSTENVFEVTAVTRRRNALFLDLVPGKAADHLVLCRIFREPHLVERLREVVPTVRAVHLPQSGTTFHAFVSMKKTAEGQPRQLLMMLFGLEPNIKLGIVCDEDIDVYDPEQVMWAMATRMQADTDTFIVPKVFCNRLDPSSVDGMSARLGIDATKPLAGWDATELTLPDDAVAAARALLAVAGVGRG